MLRGIIGKIHLLKPLPGGVRLTERQNKSISATRHDLFGQKNLLRSKRTKLILNHGRSFSRGAFSTQNRQGITVEFARAHKPRELIRQRDCHGCHTGSSGTALTDIWPLRHTSGAHNR